MIGMKNLLAGDKCLPDISRSLLVAPVKGLETTRRTSRSHDNSGCERLFGLHV